MSKVHIVRFEEFLNQQEPDPTDYVQEIPGVKLGFLLASLCLV